MAEETKERGLVEYQSRDGQSIKLTFDIVRRFYVTGRAEFVTDAEIVIYMGTCKARGLNPAKKDCYLIKYTKEDPAALVVSIDYFRSRARAQEDCIGWKTGVIVKDAAGALVYRNGSFCLPDDTLLGGWFKARPANWAEEYEWSVNVAPYVKTKQGGLPTWFWRDENQPYMIAKVAESQGLRRLWPDEFQGLFVHEEILDVTQNAPEREPEPRPSVLPEPARRVNEKERKRFVTAAQKSGLNPNDIEDKLSQYKLNTTFDIMTDKLPELMTWAETPKSAAPAEEKKPDAPDNA